MNIPERTCVICRTKKPKKELSRFLVTDGKVIFDKSQKGTGRGFYICSKECWDKAITKKRKIRIGSEAKHAINISLPEKSFEEIIK